jgi:hypothetical protein
VLQQKEGCRMRNEASAPSVVAAALSLDVRKAIIEQSLKN